MSALIQTKQQKKEPVGKDKRYLTGQKRSFMDWMGSFGTEDIGVDLGTSNVVIYVKNRGIVFPEAAMVAMKESTGEMLCYGNRAAAMEGRTPKGIRTVRPIWESAIIDYGAAAYLLSSIVNHTSLKSFFFHPRLIMCVPPGITSVQRRALLEAAVTMGTRKTVLIEQPLAAAMGMGLNTSRMVGAMIVDVGGGSANISVLSKHGIVVNDFSVDAGISMDQAVMMHVQDKYRVKIGRKAAENAKIALGASWNNVSGAHSIEVCGASLVTGLPIKLEITGEDVSEALQPILERIFQKILGVLQKTPPALLADIRDHGIMLTGGGAQQKGFDQMVTKLTGIPAYVVENPFYVNAIGAGTALEYMDMFRDSLQDLH